MPMIKSIVSGTVVNVHAAVGDRLAPGDVIVTVESMKMEIPIEAEQDCTIAEILVAPGDAVQEDADVARVE